MNHEFDHAYWDRHWGAGDAAARGARLPVSPYLPVETADLQAGSALDTGCGTGNEVLWLAEQGWEVTGADISATALDSAARRAEDAGLDGCVEWVQTDLTTWTPNRTWDLVVTSYAHPETGQLAFYRHIAAWVAPGGSLLIIGHLRGHRTGGREHAEHATAEAASIADLFTGPDWCVEACYESTRTVTPSGAPVELNDVVVRARRI